jgi:hypothetical protein
MMLIYIQIFYFLFLFIRKADSMWLINIIVYYTSAKRTYGNLTETTVIRKGHLR